MIMAKDRSLQISLTSIPETGLEVKIDLRNPWFSRWREDDPELEFSTGAIQGTVRVERHGRDILLRGQLQGRLQLACGRCLEDFTAPVAGNFDLLLVPGPQSLTEEEELSGPDLDLEYYSGDFINLQEILREQIILMVPIKPLCDEACRGLCPSCGANLNRESCSCQKEKSDSPFAALGKLKGS